MNLDNNYLDILNNISGLFAIDTDENVVYMAPDLLKVAGYSRLEEVQGRNIREILSHNNAYKILKSRRKKPCEIYLTEGQVYSSSGHPIFNNGKLIGALEYDMFQNTEEIFSFIEKLKSTRGIEHFTPININNTFTKYSLDDIKGSSSSLVNMKEEIRVAARSNSNVIISGETGTGKELVAQSIHNLGQRNLFQFVKVNCAAIPSELFESELFGYEEGSFTGAKKGGKKGLAEIADKGTLFLDEIDSLPLQMQAKLLRFIQEKEIMKIGSDKVIPIDARIIAATNKNLTELVEKEEFREDLYYRIHVIDIEVPPLRYRKSDIPELANFFIGELNNTLGRSVEKHKVKRLDINALKMLMDYDWPGNIRELRNVIERAMNRCYEESMRSEHFQDSLVPKSDDLSFDAFPITNTLEEMKEKIEKYAIKRLLTTEGITLTKAAATLGISRQMLYKKLKKYQL